MTTTKRLDSKSNLTNMRDKKCLIEQLHNMESKKMCIHFPNFISQSYRMISEDIAHKSYGKLIIYLYAAFCKFLQFIKEKYIFWGVGYFFNSKFFICNKD